MGVAVAVPCTDRKRGGPPTPDAMLRTIDPELSVADRAARWVDRLLIERAREVVQPLVDLYIGPGWRASMDLVEAISEAVGHAADGYVVSAGLGLQPLGSDGAEWPRYSATFTLRHPDAVVVDRRDAGDTSTGWWAALGRSESLGATSFARLASAHDAVVVVASAPYLRAVCEDLVAAARDGLRVVAFTASAAPLGELEQHLVRLDARARSVVPASDARASADFVAFAAARLGGDICDVRAARTFVECTLEGREAPRRPRGSTAQPEEVRSFIEAALRDDPSVRKGRLLRRWRDGGRAFEQKRFGAIYDEVSDALRGGSPRSERGPSRG